MGGALIAYPLHLVLGPLFHYPFEKLVEKATLLCGLVFAFFYLRRVEVLSLDTLGLKTPAGTYAGDFVKGFAAGLGILTLLILSLLLLDIYAFHSGRIMAWSAVVTLIIKALLTGLAVGLVEELLFRGALLNGLMKRSNALTAAIAVSLVYAAAHFIDYPPPVSPDAIHWLTAPALILDVLSGIADIKLFDALVALFLLGLLLSLIRLRTGNIIQCIGLHAGLVTGVKISRYFTQYIPDTRFGYLVSDYDHRLGWLAALWLTLAIGVYYVFRTKTKTV